MRQKGVTFGPGCQPKQNHPLSTSVMVEPKPYTWNVTTNPEMPPEFNLMIECKHKIHSKQKINTGTL